jgi:septal ring factor EnvC (AmiA/AmiB activator)
MQRVETKLETKLGQIDAKLGQLEAKLGQVETKMEVVETQNTDVKRRFEAQQEEEQRKQQCADYFRLVSLFARNGHGSLQGFVQRSTILRRSTTHISAAIFRFIPHISLLVPKQANL